MKKKGNICFTILISLIVICSGVTILTVAANSKYNTKTEYERIKSRYICESGVDMTLGLFINYISNQDLTLTYRKTNEGEYSAIYEYSPYFLNEISLSENKDKVPLEIISTETKDYLVSIGNLDFIKEGDIEVYINTFEKKEDFRIVNMCIEPDFLISKETEEENKESKIKPIYLTLKSKYKEGEVFCDVKISGLKAVRKPFYEISEDEMGNVEAWIDTKDIKIEYENYQNYRTM